MSKLREYHLCTISSLPLRKEWNLRRYFIRCKMFILYVWEDTFCTEGSRLWHFIIISNNNEYKRIVWDEMSLGQLYDVQTWIKISNHPLAKLIMTTNIRYLQKLLKMPSLLAWAGSTKGGSITVPLTSCLTGLESAAWQVTIFVFICKTD
jgi:hypothetical protein